MKAKKITREEYKAAMRYMATHVRFVKAGIDNPNVLVPVLQHAMWIHQGINGIVGFVDERASHYIAESKNPEVLQFMADLQERLKILSMRKE